MIVRGVKFIEDDAGDVRDAFVTLRERGRSSRLAPTPRPSLVAWVGYAMPMLNIQALEVGGTIEPKETTFRQTSCGDASTSMPVVTA